MFKEDNGAKDVLWLRRKKEPTKETEIKQLQRRHSTRNLWGPRHQEMEGF